MSQRHSSLYTLLFKQTGKKETQKFSQLFQVQIFLPYLHPLLCMCLGWFSLDLRPDFGLCSSWLTKKYSLWANFTFSFPACASQQFMFAVCAYLNLTLLLLARLASTEQSHFYVITVPGSLFVAVLIPSYLEQLVPFTWQGPSPTWSLHGAKNSSAALSRAYLVTLPCHCSWLSRVLCSVGEMICVKLFFNFFIISSMNSHKTTVGFSPCTLM